jgi:hypothetical protein
VYADYVHAAARITAAETRPAAAEPASADDIGGRAMADL